IGVYHLCLALYCKSEDICSGIPIAGRTRQDTEAIVGLFLNGLAIRSKPEASLPISEYFERLKHNVLDAFTHQDLPSDTLVEHLNIDRNLVEVPGTQFGFILQNTHDKNNFSALPSFESEALSLRFLPFQGSTSKHDICLSMGERDLKFSGSI